MQSLPTEIAVHVFNFAIDNPRVYLVCALTCRDFHRQIALTKYGVQIARSTSWQLRSYREIAVRARVLTRIARVQSIEVVGREYEPCDITVCANFPSIGQNVTVSGSRNTRWIQVRADDNTCYHFANMLDPMRSCSRITRDEYADIACMHGLIVIMRRNYLCPLPYRMTWTRQNAKFGWCTLV